MADAPIYLNPSNPRNVIQWGERVYYFNSHRQGGDYGWHADNLQKAPGSPSAAQINTSWAFAGQWQPSDKPTVIDAELKTNKSNTVDLVLATESQPGTDFEDCAPQCVHLRHARHLLLERPALRRPPVFNGWFQHLRSRGSGLREPDG